MFYVPQHIKGITHPLVKTAYLIKENTLQNRTDNVLVIETFDFEHSDDKDHEMFDVYLLDLLSGLEKLQEFAEKQVGHLDRVDIRAH